MAITSTTRLGLTRWSAATDPFTRDQMDTSHERLESRVAAFFSGTDINDYPAATYARSFFYNTSTQILFYSNGSTWQSLTQYGTTIYPLSPSSASATGTATTAARSDHVHSLPGWGTISDIQTVQTSASAGDDEKFARADHVHALAANSVTSGTIASGAISSSTAFVAGVVNENAIATAAVTKTKIASDQQIPAGVVMAYVGATAPTGWLLCDGTSYAKASYADLWNVLSAQNYGSNSTHFNVPDLRDRIPRGAATTGTTLGVNAGADTVTLAAANLPNHTHSAGTLDVPDHVSHVHSTNISTDSNSDANHTHTINSHGHTASLANGTVAGNSTVFGTLYGPSGDGAGNGSADGGLFPDYWSGGPSPIPVNIAAASVTSLGVTVNGSGTLTSNANTTADIQHTHNITANTGGPTTTLSHDSLTGETGNPVGTVGTALSVIPKTQTVNYIIKI